MIILRTLYVLLVTLAGVVYCYYASINTYWTQTHHTDSPMVQLEQWWRGQPAIVAEVIEETIDPTVEQETQADIVESAEQHEPLETVETMETVEETPAMDTPAIVLESLHDREELIRDNETDHESDLSIENPPTTPENIVLSAGDQLFFVGDSLMQGVAPKVKQTLYKAHKIGGIDLSKQSTGLSYPKFFNWPQVVEETLQKNANIKAMFVFLGPNDPWDFPVKGQKYYLRFKSEAWEAAYRERIQRILKAAQSKQIPVVWLGVPCMRKTKLHKDVIYLNGLYADEVKRFNGHFIPTYDLLGCSEEKYSAYAKTAQGNAKVRTDDGIHFTVRGQKMLADRIIEELTIESTAEETK